MTRLLFGDDAFIFEIALVPQEKLIYCAGRVLLDVPEPISNVLERVFFGDIEHQQDAHGVPVVRGGDSPEPLLARGVKKLQFNLLAI